jgi:citrate lyase beta subunit
VQALISIKALSRGPLPSESRQVKRQPVHVVYGGAHLFKADVARRLGDLALRSLSLNAPDAEQLGDALGLKTDLTETVYSRVLAKLKREPVEDYRVDFEDGYGSRSDAEEDDAAARAAVEMARGISEAGLPPFIGIRIKPLTEVSRRRALRTLDIFLHRIGSILPPNFVVTVPKVASPKQVESFCRLHPDLKIELMIETPESIFAIRELVAAAGGRCRGAHFGAYDYTAALDIAANHQALDHPACDFARSYMQAALAGSGIMLSDGALNILPVGEGSVVHRAWRMHFQSVQRSMMLGFYQGWDLHPAQLVARYAAVDSFFLEGLAAASARLRNFIDRSEQATRVGEVFDDAATGEGLLNFFRLGLSCGAITPQEASEAGYPEEI